MDLAERAMIKTFFRDLLAEHDDHEPFGDAESLVAGGRLDSLSVAKIVTFLETEFGVDFVRIEFDPARFDSVAEIAALIDESRQL
ncbi:MAG TPA: hypothetical protein VMU96_13390 [Casimicrobiaceae bacterium]|nr:hypothetical protein [Casimicrobiaceae bacterium]